MPFWIVALSKFVPDGPIIPHIYIFYDVSQGWRRNIIHILQASRKFTKEIIKSLIISLSKFNIRFLLLVNFHTSCHNFKLRMNPSPIPSSFCPLVFPTQPKNGPWRWNLIDDMSKIVLIQFGLICYWIFILLFCL